MFLRKTRLISLVIALQCLTTFLSIESAASKALSKKELSPAHPSAQIKSKITVPDLLKYIETQQIEKKKSRKPGEENAAEDLLQIINYLEPLIQKNNYSLFFHAEKGDPYYYATQHSCNFMLSKNDEQGNPRYKNRPFEGPSGTEHHFNEPYFQFYPKTDFGFFGEGNTVDDTDVIKTTNVFLNIISKRTFERFKKELHDPFDQPKLLRLLYDLCGGHDEFVKATFSHHYQRPRGPDGQDRPDVWVALYLWPWQNQE